MASNCISPHQQVAPDVANQLRAAAGAPATEPLSSLHLLTWVMGNTVRATTSGLLEWSKQGFHFAKTRGDGGANELQPVPSDLSALYGAARKRDAPVDDAINDLLPRVSDGVAERSGPLGMAEEAVALIRERAKQWGQGQRLVATADEECERELALEVRFCPNLGLWVWVWV